MPDSVNGAPPEVVREAVQMARDLGHPAVLAKASHPHAQLPWRVFDSWKEVERGYVVRCYVRSDGTMRVLAA
jgi:hypothetical protein